MLNRKSSFVRPSVTQTVLTVAAASIFFLTGCNSTRDLNPDDRAPFLSLGVNKRISERVVVAGEYSAVKAESSEVFDGDEPVYSEGTVEADEQAIQINDQRFVASPSDPLSADYDYFLETFKFELAYEAVQGDIYSLTLATGLMHFNYDLDVYVEGNQFKIEDSEIGWGLALENTFHLRSDLSLNFGFGLYDMNDTGNLLTQFVELDYQLMDNLNLMLGYKATYIDGLHAGPTNGDGCRANDLPEDCENSEVNMGAQGVVLGLEYKF